MSDVIGTARERDNECATVFPRQTKSLLMPSSSLDELIFRENIAYRRFRRALGMAVAALLLLAVTPALLMASSAIILEDGGPFFFTQLRVGRFGRVFKIYKLRTMRKDKCTDEPSPTSGRDPRITRVGHWLRRSSIDELPQLINIIKGEMAFVGPRPEMVFHVREYQDWQHLRHLVTPGVTGFWQVTRRKSLPMYLPEATLLDLDYIARASLATDLLILAKTVREVLLTTSAF